MAGSKACETCFAYPPALNSHFVPVVFLNAVELVEDPSLFESEIGPFPNVRFRDQRRRETERNKRRSISNEKHH